MTPSLTPPMSIPFGAFFGQAEPFWYDLQVGCDFRALSKERKRLVTRNRPAAALAKAR